MEISDIAHTGEGIGKTDAFTWFVKDSLIGDKVKALVMKTKKSYGYAKLIEVLQESKDRIQPLCAVAKACGGCNLQSMSYEAELDFKQHKVLNNLSRIGGIDLSGVEIEDIIGMEDPVRYRNKAVFPVGTDKNGNLIAGFYAGRTHHIIENKDCIIGIEENKEIVQTILDFCTQYKISAYHEESGQGILRHILIRKGFATGEIMVCLVINKPTFPHADILVEKLLTFQQIKTICLNINKENTNVIMGKEIKILYGDGYITDFIGDIKFRISPLSFYQVNPKQTALLYEKALEYANLQGDEVVWDLYCGIGSISLFLARQAKKVYGIEIIKEAITDANVNAKLNAIDNVSFFVGKAEEVLPQAYDIIDAMKHTHSSATENKELYHSLSTLSTEELNRMIQPDVIVVDPPRKGCDTACLDTMIKMNPKRIVYVSCDSATLARDVKILCENGYTLQKVQVVDQFARSVHVESVALMQRVKS